MPHSLTSEQVASYEQQGILFPIPVLADEEVPHFRSGYDDLIAAFDHTPKSTELVVTHLQFRWAWDLVTHPSLSNLHVIQAI